MKANGGAGPALISLISRLKTYAVDWKFSFVPTENVEYEVGTDREIADLADANVVSSEIHRSFNADDPQWRRHAVLLDIDYPAYVIETSTPGHHHVYLDVPGGVSHEGMMEILEVLGRHGVIEKGYAEVSIKRGHSDLRLPWVRKEDQKLSTTNPESPTHPGETISPRTWEDLIGEDLF